MTESAPWVIDPKRAALLVIDMQNDFVLAGRPMEVPAAKTVIPTIARLAKRCREIDVPVIYTQHVLIDGFDVSPLESAYNTKLRSVGMRDGTDGIDVVAGLAPEASEVLVRKHRYDAFHNTRLDTVLQTIRGFRGVDTVIITGTLTEVCCESTARSAFMRDYRVAFVSDGTAARLEGAQEATERAIGTFFGRVLSADQVIAELSV